MLRGEFSDNNHGNAERYVHADSDRDLHANGFVHDDNEEHTINPDRAVTLATGEHKSEN
jgi:hypothetical protein